MSQSDAEKDAHLSWERMVIDTRSQACKNIRTALDPMSAKVARDLNAALAPLCNHAQGDIVNQAVTLMMTELAKKVASLAEQQALNKLVKEVQNQARINDVMGVG